MKTIHGTVEKGLGEARATGFPTINIAYTLPQDETLEAGVYAVEVHADGRVFDAASSVGADWGAGQFPKLEVYIFEVDAESDWCGKTVDVVFLKKTRDLVRFKNATDARAHITRDVEEIKNFFANE